MFDRIFDFLEAVWDLFAVWTIVDEWEEGVVLRFGKFNRAVEPGRRWIWPFAIEEVMTHSIKTTTRNLETQVLTTADKRSIVMGLVLKYRVTDIQTFLLEIGDDDTHGDEVLVDMAYGMLSWQVQQTRWEDITEPQFAHDVREKIRRRSHRLGIEVEELWVTDCSSARTLRLVLGE